MKIIIKDSQQLLDLRTAQTNSIRKTVEKLKDSLENPLFFDHLKFEKFGHDPVDPNKPMNLIEQINLNATYVVALKAVEYLMTEFPNKHWHVKPGPSGAGSDIESLDGEVCAEVFAAVSASSNGKLAKDLSKVRSTNAKHKYVFLMTASGEIDKADFPFGIRVVEFPREKIL